MIQEPWSLHKEMNLRQFMLLVNSCQSIQNFKFGHHRRSSPSHIPPLLCRQNPVQNSFGSCCTHAVFPRTIFWAEGASATLLCMLWNNSMGTDIPSPGYVSKRHGLWKASKRDAKPKFSFYWQILVLFTVKELHKTEL